MAQEEIQCSVLQVKVSVSNSEEGKHVMSMLKHNTLACLSHLRFGATSSVMMNRIYLSTGRYSLILKCYCVGIYVRALRDGDFLLHVQVSDELVDWLHAFIQENYARSMSVYVKDMVQLKDCHPDIFKEFMNGHFVVQRSLHKFSLIGKDQSHGQSNKILQSNGGISDLYGSTCCMLMIQHTEFENILSSIHQSTARHVETPSLHINFIDIEDMKPLTDFLRKRGNLFCDTSSQLAKLGTRDAMKEQVPLSLIKCHELGKILHKNYVINRIENNSRHNSSQQSSYLIGNIGKLVFRKKHSPCN